MAGDDGRAQVQLDEDTLARRRRDLGEDHPHTLAPASNLAVSLRAAGALPAAGGRRGGGGGDAGPPGRRRGGRGEARAAPATAGDGLAGGLAGVDGQAARELGEDTLARRRRVLGEDHPDTLASASNLVMILGRVGEHQAARELAEDTLARRRPVLGEDHPATLTAAFILAAALFELGEYHAARELNDHIIAPRR